MTRWVMLADLERCVGCQTCTAACRHANATSPAVQWRKVLDIEAGSYPNVSRIFVPVGCQHCADPPCMHVCPTSATRQRADGIVTIDYDICIGCAYCEVACPYQARFLLHGQHFAYDAAMQNETERADLARVGVAQKCTFCSDRIDFGIEYDLVPGLDPRATPACVNACIADALHFGDADDPGSNVSRLLKEQMSFRMHAELGTEPGFHYLYGKAGGAEQPSGVRPPDAVVSAGQIRARGVEPALQTHWDWKAASNFICGGLGSALFFFTASASLVYGELIPLAWAALAIVALGLSLLLLKIGRPLRAAYVLRQPERSWMAREARIAGLFFPLAAAALWFAVPPMQAGAAVLALMFLTSQAMILREAKGIPAWRIGWIVPLVIGTGLAEGCGLFLAVTAQIPGLETLAQVAGVIAVVLVALRGWFWQAYLGALENAGGPERALAVLYGFWPWFFLGGVVLPFALIVVGLAISMASAVLFATGGLCIAATGAALKFILVTRAGFNQGFALAHTPVRGSGLAGPAVKPGWSTP
jgi:phenylacetyl-CoA:acceptor oxidoreductase subunit 1